jgi:hypothetical protein
MLMITQAGSPGTADAPGPGARTDEQPAWLQGARAAPSAHNTQPWRFTRRPDGRVAVGWDPERTLPAGDPTYRDLYLALGAAVESARLQAAAAGTPLLFYPMADEGDGIVGYLIPSDGLPRAAMAGEDPLGDPDPVLDRRLAAVLDARHTARIPHLPRPVPTALVDALQHEARRHGCRLYVVAGREGIRRLAHLARRATAAQFADLAVHAELWRWLRLDPGDPAYRRDGLTAECIDLCGIALLVARLALPPARMRALTRVGAHHVLALDTERVVRRSAALCLLTAPSERRNDVVLAGRVLQRLWLLAAEAGLTTHPISALLDCAETAGPARGVFGATGRVAAALYRMGYTAAVPRAPRLPSDELVSAEGRSEPAADV